MLDAGTESRLHAEAQVLGGLLSPLAGRVAVQIGACAHQCIPPERFTDVFSLDPDEERAMIRARVEALPLSSESVDLVLMMHSMDRPGPRSAWLAEAARVLRPEGRLVVVGCRAWRCEWVRSRTSPLGVWRLRLLAARHGLSWEYARALKGAEGSLPGVYVAAARRHVPGTTLLRPAWTRQKKKARHSLEVPGAGRAG